MELFQTPLGFWYGFLFSLVLCGGVQALIQCYFLIRFSSVKSRPSYYLIYIGISYSLLAAGLVLPIPENLPTLIGILVVFVFVNVILRQSKMTSVILSTLVVAGTVLIESITTPLYALLSNSLKMNSIALNLSEGIVMLALTYLVLRFFAARYNLKTNEKSKFLPVLALPLLFISIVLRLLLDFRYPPIFKDYQMTYQATAIEDFQFLFLAVTAFLCVCGSLFAFEKVISYLETERANSILESQLSMQKSYAEEAKARYEATRAFRHDFKNHLIALSGLIEKGETENAKKYLERFEQISQRMSFSVSTGNTAVDALLSEKLAYAENSGIHVELDAAIPPTVTVDDFDLCAVFSNALDNAIKACGSAKNRDKILRITARPNKDFFLIDMSNTYEPECVPKGTGIGLPVIKMIVEKYHGAIEISEENSVFFISMILPFNKK
ncbi:MAG TPA: GHKL domain-containing protein [Clostridia bacterium]|nr:GHKL domain-containing protein [Clostridia bacterium]